MSSGSNIGNKAIRVGVIGSRGHWNILTRELSKHPEIEVVGVADGGEGDPVQPVIDAVVKAGREAPQRFTTWQELLAGARLDVVVINGPFELHAPMTVAAMDGGTHVICEKAIALTWEDLAAIEGAISRNPGIHLAPMMQLRFSPGMQALRKLVSDGTLGEVRLVNSRKSYKLGKRDPYYHDRKTYGGTIPWVGAHALDWIVYYMGTELKTVSALHSSGGNNGYGTLETTASVQLALSRGRIASASIDYLRPADSPTHGDDWVRVVGTKGVAEAREDHVDLITTPGGPRRVEGLHDRTFLSDFLGHITGKSPTLVPIEESLVVTRALLLARDAADSGEMRKF